MVENGLIKQGNHRVKVLEERGYTTQQIIEMVDGRRLVGSPANLPSTGTVPAKITKEEAVRRLFGDPPPPGPGSPP